MRRVSIGSILRSGRSQPAAAKRSSRQRVALVPALMTILASLCASAPAAFAANFTCSWNDATANWTTVADWSSCNSTFPHDDGANTYNVVIPTGVPTLTTDIGTNGIGTATINTSGTWSTGSGGRGTINGIVTNSGTFHFKCWRFKSHAKNRRK